jgi:Flp pilus assembly protein TadD
MADDDPYEVLGVADGVTPTDLKKAYYRKIREHPPEFDPDGYQRVQRAYQTATDPEYPTLRRHGKEIDTLLAEVNQLMEKGEHAAAIRPLKKVLVLHPDSDAARNLLGICQTQSSEWDDAKRTFSKLVGQKPDTVLYRINYAWVFISQARATAL